jgi:IMP dehydrogenase
VVISLKGFLMAKEIHPQLKCNEFSLDDVLIPPASKPPEFDPSVVDTTARLTKKITLKFPIIGSPMDTVTGPEMAIFLAEMGGIAVIPQAKLNIRQTHQQSVESQAQQIAIVRRERAGFVLEPKVLGPKATVLDVIKGEQEFGYSSYPVTKDGTTKTSIIGIITGADVQDVDASEYNLPVRKVMTPRAKLVYAKREETLDINDIRAANRIIRARKLDTLPILDNEDRVVALVTRSDIKKDDKFPLATKDQNKQLQVLAAVESRPQLAIPRIEAIANSGIAGIVIDSRNIYGGYKEIAAYAKKQNPDLDVIVGNIVHPNVLRVVLEEAGGLIDAFRVGIGTGEVCTTSEDLGVGRAMGSALNDLNKAFNEEINKNDRYGYIGFIPDGGIKFPRHFFISAILIKNFAGVMMGSYLAGFDQSASPKIQREPGVNVKSVRGMGSAGAIEDRFGPGSSRYGQERIDPSKRYPEGIQKDIPAIGDGHPHLERFRSGVQTAMQSVGAKNIEELYQIAVVNTVSKAASKGTL